MKTYEFVRPATTAQIGETATEDQFDAVEGSKAKHASLGGVKRLLELGAIREITPMATAKLPPAPPETLYAGRPLAEYAGKTDAQINKMRGVTDADVLEIRAALTTAGL